MAIRLGDTVPNFSAESTDGHIDFYDWKGDSWALLFSHPKDFTPVCTTELGAVAGLKPEFDKRGVKIIGVSVDPLDSHKGWAEDIEDVTGNALSYPLIADPDRKVAEAFDMIHPNELATATVRTVFVIAPDNTVKLSLTYPASTGRNWQEIIRAIDSIQLTANHSVSTPSDWTQGDAVIAAPTFSDEEAEAKFGKIDKKKDYLRFVAQPG
ncbi:MAG TPA: peroxiredoxin [Acidimicrobiales bacterium]|nr:peroxiredoxin [Acidimicrobiales bacterium]